jgi:hypothetical protein
MNLREIRELFVETSGRYDLVEDTVNFQSKKPLGADLFINEGQKLLDRLSPGGRHRRASMTVTLQPGQFEVKSSALRAVKTVRIESSEGTRFLQHKAFRPLRVLFGDRDQFPQIERGVPVYYTPVSVRSVDTPTNESETHAGVLILPPAESGLTVIVEGVFFSPQLVEETDESYWTLVQPATLVQAAWYMLERFYRNTEGMKDHMLAIQQDLDSIDFDEAEEEAASVSTMRNSW